MDTKKCKCGCGNDVDQQHGHRKREYYNDACKARYHRSGPATVTPNVTDEAPIATNKATVTPIVTSNTPPATQPLKPQPVDLEDPSTWPSRAPGEKMIIAVDPAEPGGDSSAPPTRHEQQAADAGRGTVVHTDPLEADELEALRIKTGKNHVNRVPLPGDPGAWSPGGWFV